MYNGYHQRVSKYRNTTLFVTTVVDLFEMKFFPLFEGNNAMKRQSISYLFSLGFKLCLQFMYFTMILNVMTECGIQINAQFKSMISISNNKYLIFS